MFEVWISTPDGEETYKMNYFVLKELRKQLIEEKTDKFFYFMDINKMVCLNFSYMIKVKWDEESFREQQRKEER